MPDVKLITKTGFTIGTNCTRVASDSTNMVLYLQPQRRMILDFRYWIKASGIPFDNPFDGETFILNTKDAEVRID